MLKANATSIVKDFTTFIVNEADLTAKKIGEYLETPDRDVRHSDGLKWSVRWFPAGDRLGSAGHLGVFLKINKPVKLKMTTVVEGVKILASTVADLRPGIKGFPKYATHTALQPLFHHGKLKIICSIEMEMLVPFAYETLRIADSCGHVPTDLELVMATGKVEVHKSLLSLMSPVFHAMFSHNTAESKFGQVQITDVEFETVKTAVDLIYGRKVTDTSVKMVINILRFADKYDIKAISAQLESIPQSNLTPETFCIIVQYAYDCSKDDLLTKCCQFLNQNQNAITVFTDLLPPPMVASLLQHAFALQTHFDVLRHAHMHGFVIVMGYLEYPLLKSLSLGNFCPAVNYAWDCSRDELKKACATFFNDHQFEVTTLEAFINLPPHVVHGVLKLAFELKK